MLRGGKTREEVCERMGWTPELLTQLLTKDLAGSTGEGAAPTPPPAAEARKSQNYGLRGPLAEAAEAYNKLGTQMTEVMNWVEQDLTAEELEVVASAVYLTLRNKDSFIHDLARALTDKYTVIPKRIQSNGFIQTADPASNPEQSAPPASSATPEYTNTGRGSGSGESSNEPVARSEELRQDSATD